MIRACKEPYVINDYTSARLNTHGKFAFEYGKIQARMKTASGQGLRCKLFMLPEKLEYGAWARSGQIDVMETSGPNPHSVKGGIVHGGQGHYNEYSGGVFSPRASTFPRTTMSTPSNGNPTKFAGLWTESSMPCRTVGAVSRRLSRTIRQVVLSRARALPSTVTRRKVTFPRR